MTITTACSPQLDDSLLTDTVYVSCQRWTRPMMSVIKTLRLRDTRLRLVHTPQSVCSFVVLVRSCCHRWIRYTGCGKKV